MLAKRLIHTLSVSMDAEEGMISRLKVSYHSIALTASYAKPVPGNRTRVIWQTGRRRWGKRAPARFSRQFSQSLHIFILELVNRPLNDIHLRLGGRRGGGGCALYDSTTSPPTLQNHTPNPRPSPPVSTYVVRYVIFLVPSVQFGVQSKPGLPFGTNISSMKTT